MGIAWGYARFEERDGKSLALALASGLNLNLNLDLDWGLQAHHPLSHSLIDL
jgi:hypothetical protein